MSDGGMCAAWGPGAKRTGGCVSLAIPRLSMGHSGRKKAETQLCLTGNFGKSIAARKIAFMALVRAPRAKDVAWGDWAARAKSLPSSHITLVRDYPPYDSPFLDAVRRFGFPDGWMIDNIAISV